MAHEYTLFSHLRTGRTVRAHAHARNVFQKFQNVAMRACTLRSQLVAKVRASPNNGFPHEEQIGGTIYLSGTLAWTCVFLHANRLRYLICVHTDTPPLFSFPWSTWNQPADIHIDGMWRSQRGMHRFPCGRKKEERSTLAEKSRLHLITAVGHCCVDTTGFRRIFQSATNSCNAIERRLPAGISVYTCREWV